MASTSAWQERQSVKLGTLANPLLPSLRYLQQVQQAQQVLAVQLSRGAATQLVTATKGKSSMVDEFRTYVREYKDWIFTIAIIAIVDHFFLDGALKEKLGAALGKKLDTHGDVKA